MDAIQNVLEWIVVAVLFLGGVSLLFAEPVTTGTAIGTFLGSKAAGIVYSCVFFALGAGLTYAKKVRSRSLHGRMLLAIYLFLLFTIILEIMIIGFGWYCIDNVVGTVLVAGLWLRWRIRTEYIDPKQFSSEINTIRFGR